MTWVTIRTGTDGAPSRVGDARYDAALLPHEASGSRMGVRVWGVVEDRLIEVRVEPAESGAGLRVEGVPEDRARTTADRIRAALINSELVREVPAAVVTLEPNLRAGCTSELDVSIALALLASVGRLCAHLRWVLATGRLGLDGAVESRDLPEPTSIVTIVTALGGMWG